MRPAHLVQEIPIPFILAALTQLVSYPTVNPPAQHAVIPLCFTSTPPEPPEPPEPHHLNHLLLPSSKTGSLLPSTGPLYRT
jgi:hypothetical protein